MRLAEIRRVLRRSDLRASLWIGTLLLVFTAAGERWYWGFAATEGIEEAEHWLAYVLDDTARDFESGTADTGVRQPDRWESVRITGPDGAIAFQDGDWPSPEHSVFADASEDPDQASGANALQQLRRDHWLVGGRPLSDGRRLEAAVPLTHFAREHAEIGRILLSNLLVVGAAAYLLGFLVTLRAFAPLRRATHRLKEVDASHLRLRLPSRGTGDPIDVHAETLNRVLGHLDSGFERLRAFSSNTAHELRTPLNRIATVTEVALLEGGEPELRSALESVDRSLGDLSQVVQSLLLLSEVDERRRRPGGELVDVPAWLEQHAAAYGPPFADAGVELALRSDPIAIRGERALLDRVIENLLDNALQYAPAGSRVEVGASRRGDGVRITVDDAGPGIPKRDRERIFDRFERLGSSRAGHGLGLALARAIAALHGGSLSADVSPAGGARLVLWLPAASAAVAPRRRAAETVLEPACEASPG